MNFDYPFTEHDAQAAFDDWGCNCGPSSLAFALQIGLDKVRGKIPGFEAKRYTSPTMMKAALANLGREFKRIKNADGEVTIPTMFSPHGISLVRVQWCGPWTKKGANPKWAYRQTHWIATWAFSEEVKPIGGCKTTRMGLFVFDCNGGIRSFASWQKEIVPALTATYPRADGNWFPTDVWRIVPVEMENTYPPYAAKPSGYDGMTGFQIEDLCDAED
jgi:hypothetical protein